MQAYDIISHSQSTINLY